MSKHPNSLQLRAATPARLAWAIRDFASQGLKRYPEWTLHEGAAQRAVLGSALLLAAIALLALGIGALLRHSAAAISSLLALLLVPLIVGPLLPERTGDLLQRATPGAGLAVQQTVARDDAIPIAPWAGLGVAFAWAGGALLLAYFLIRRRDA